MTKTILESVIVVSFGMCLGCAQVPFSADAPAKTPIEIAIEDAQGNGIAITAGLLELDDIEQAGQVSRKLLVRNVSQSAILVKQAASSCECVTFDGLPAEIARGAAAYVRLRVNLQQERNFVGEMQVEVSLSVRQSSGADLGSAPLKIRFRVIPQHDSAA